MLQQFFNSLKDQLNSAREIEEKMGRESAHRFNVLKYLDTREIGLSHIIGDLLDPNECHGQGSFFLKMLLEKLDIDPREKGLNLDDARVIPERFIENDRRIDISIEIPSNDGKYCFAFENKPWAKDQETQVIDYLNFLCNEYGNNRFWLIYLSPRGEPPDENSLPRAEINDGQWEGRLMVMAYSAYVGQFITEDKFKDYRTPCTFVDWITACHDKCRVDKLRWFLRDIESYCKNEIGDQTMPNDFETETVRNFLFENTNRLEIARQVSDSWPAVRSQVCSEFLEHLRFRFEDKMNEPELFDECGGVHIEPVQDNAQVVGITLSQPGWDDPGCEFSGISICLEHETSPYKCWFFGVYLPSWNRENNQNDQLRNNLVDQLNEGSRPHNKYPWWHYVKRDYRDWNYLVPELHLEAQNPGRITEYFVNEFVGIARAAIPIINNLNN